MSTLSTMVVKLVAETGPFVSAMEDAGKTAQKIGGVLATAAAAGVAALGAAMAASISKTVEWGDQLDSLGDVLGTNANESAALAVAIKGVGGDVDGITGQMAKFVNGLTNAKGELGPTGEVMNKLGISFRDANGQLLPSTTLLENIANRLTTMPDGLEKTAIMTDLFGKSGKDLSDTMNALANGGLAQAEQKAKDFGLAIGEDGVNKSLAFKRGLADLQMAGEGLMVTLGNELLPILTPLLQKFVEFAQKHMPDIKQAIKGVVDFVEGSLIPLFEKIAPVLANPFEYAKNTIIQGLLVLEAFAVDTINGLISGINNFTNELARVMGTTNDLYIPLLKKREVSVSSGGFAYGMGNGPESVAPNAGAQMNLVINLAPGQTEQQGGDAARAFVREARAAGMFVA